MDQHLPPEALACRRSRAMAADPDIVLNTAADLTRAAAWLPAHARVVGAGDDEVEVTWTPDGETYRYTVTVRPDDHTIEWRPVAHDGWRGGLRVTDAGAGASEVELHVEAGDQDDEAVCRLLDAALRGLSVEVDQNFNVS
jgi:hypothetical protein